MKDIPLEHFMDLGDRPRVAATMAKAVGLVYGARIYTATMCLITSYIDAIAGGDKAKYLELLEKNFPRLCVELTEGTKLGQLVFYEKFRNGMIHLNSPLLGYALLEDHEAEEKYVADVRVGTLEMRGINVDRLAREFIALAESLGAGARPEGV